VRFLSFDDWIHIKKMNFTDSGKSERYTAKSPKKYDVVNKYCLKRNFITNTAIAIFINEIIVQILRNFFRLESDIGLFCAVTGTFISTTQSYASGQFVNHGHTPSIAFVGA